MKKKHDSVNDAKHPKTKMVCEGTGAFIKEQVLSYQMLNEAGITLIK